jgi:hypothetical protein
MSSDYIPHQDGAFLEWAITLLEYASPKVAAFNIPDGVLPPIRTQLDAYEAAFKAVLSPNHGKVDVLNKNEAKEALTHSVRAFVRGYLTYNPAVSDADKESMGLPLHDNTRTPAPVPSTIPELELDSSVIRQITVQFKDAGGGKRGKPEHVHGVELRWESLDAAPSSVDGLKNSAFARRVPTLSSLTRLSAASRCIFVPAGKITEAIKVPGARYTRRLSPRGGRAGGKSAICRAPPLLQSAVPLLANNMEKQYS